MLKKVLIGGAFLVGGVLFIKYILPKSNSETNEDSNRSDFSLSDVSLDDIDFEKGSAKYEARKECEEKHKSWEGNYLDNYFKIGNCMEKKGFPEENRKMDLSGTRKDGKSIFTPNWIL